MEECEILADQETQRSLLADQETQRSLLADQETRRTGDDGYDPAVRGRP